MLSPDLKFPGNNNYIVYVLIHQHLIEILKSSVCVDFILELWTFWGQANEQCGTQCLCKIYFVKLQYILCNSTDCSVFCATQGIALFSVQRRASVIQETMEASCINPPLTHTVMHTG